MKGLTTFLFVSALLLFIGYFIVTIVASFFAITEGWGLSIMVYFVCACCINLFLPVFIRLKTEKSSFNNTLNILSIILSAILILLTMKSMIGINQEIELYNNGYEAIEEKIKNIIVLATEAATVIKQINAKISKVGTAEDVCPTCLRPIDVDDRKYFEDEKKSLNTNVILLNNNILKFKTDSDLLKDKKTKIKLHILKINDELNVLKVKIKNRESLQKLINDLIDLNNQLTESITSINNNDNSSSALSCMWHSNILFDRHP